MANRLAKIIPSVNAKQNLVFDWSSLGLLYPPQTKLEPIEVPILIGEPGSELDLMVYKTVNFETESRNGEKTTGCAVVGKSDILLDRKSHGRSNSCNKGRSHHKSERRMLKRPSRGKRDFRIQMFF
ncbi:hypothetical protein AVEN_1161-1 [Araneus ventricosus]|uniref:Uncharacterized protein n=1 Tax=Araneus ventricosus TaxID=182803 RepID=A0A4Y2KPU8_ARAVE|nr:hypothetical protein AVEN_1161-1 [Araneus ventricosus]